MANYDRDMLCVIWCIWYDNTIICNCVHFAVKITSDLGYVDYNVATQANKSANIPDAPSKSAGYIPVVVWHSNIEDVIDNVFYGSGSWKIVSNVTQTATVRFYKYPL